MLVPPQHSPVRGFLYFDGFKLVSMSCEARLIETGVCFLDIFLVLEFPLPSVLFFSLSLNIRENSFVITRKTEKKKIKKQK